MRRAYGIHGMGHRSAPDRTQLCTVIDAACFLLGLVRFPLRRKPRPKPPEFAAIAWIAPRFHRKRPPAKLPLDKFENISIYPLYLIP